MNDTDNPADFSNGWLPPAPGAKPYPLRLADALDAFRAAGYAFDPNSADAARQRQRLAQALQAHSGTESAQSPSSGASQTSLLINDPSWVVKSPKVKTASVLQNIGASLTEITGGEDDALRLSPRGSQSDNEMARTQHRIDELERQNNLLASQINAERVHAASANGEDLAPTLTNAARLGLYDTFAGGDPVPFTPSSASSSGPVDRMGQPLNGPSNYDSFEKLKDILTSNNGESLSPGRLWDWATYTAPDADKLRTELGIKYGLLRDPRFAQLDQMEGSPLSAVGYDVAKLLKADPSTERLLSNLGLAADGMLMSGAVLRGRAPAFAGVQRNFGNVIQAGGAHGDIRGLHGYEAHHMPANSISPLKPNKGPAIEMLTEDHRKTDSWGRKGKAKEYRQKQKDLIERGDFGAAQRMDIQDVQEKFGDKYDDAIRQMIEDAAKKGR